MESQSNVTLFLLLCLAFSVARARPLVPPGDSDPDASSELERDASPYRKPVALSRLAPKTSPTPAASPQQGPSLSPSGGPAASPWSEDFSFESVGQPEGSAAMNDMEAQLKGPSANDAVNEAAKYVSELEAPMPSMESIEDELAPAASAVKDQAAALGPAVSSVASAAKDTAAELGPAASSVASAAKDTAAELGPAASAAMNKVAAWAAELRGQPAN